jgi:hypothetical protein
LRSYFGRVISVHMLCLADCSTQPLNHNMLKSLNSFSVRHLVQSQSTCTTLSDFGISLWIVDLTQIPNLAVSCNRLIYLLKTNNLTDFHVCGASRALLPLFPDSDRIAPLFAMRH